MIQNTRKAFSLVELLVVIGIIALLISILLPSLSRAQAAAKMVSCKSNIRQLLMAHAQYSIEFHDAKPPLWQKRTLTTVVDNVSPDIKWNGKPVGQGILVDRKYVVLRSLTCPSPEMGDDVLLDLQNWDNAALSRSGSSYVYFYRPADSGLTAATFNRGVTYNNLWRRGYKAMIMDICAAEGNGYAGEYSGRQWIAHRRMKRTNVGFGDSSVQEFPAADVMMQAPGGASEEIAWFDVAHKLYGK